MDTPITLSSSSTIPSKSDFIQLTCSPRNNDNSVITLDSSSCERVPVSWSTKTIPIERTASNTTLTNIQKVSSWIKSIEGDEDKMDSSFTDLGDVKKHDTSFSSSVNVSAAKSDKGSDSKSLILVRCDFNKSVTAKTYYPPVNPFNHSTSLINYFKKENKKKTSSAISKTLPCTDQNKKIVFQKHLLLKRAPNNRLNNSNEINRKHSFDKESFCPKVDDEKSDTSSDTYEVSSSPESRKKELCTYLQLMNPADKKEIFIFQNRRSTRVKNLAAMQEKKQLEKKIMEENIEENSASQNEAEKCMTLKSFKELNIKVEKCNFEDVFKARTYETNSEVESFYFPFPPRELIQRVNNFDNVMSKLVPRYKKICNLKKLKLNSRALLKFHTVKCKENLLKSRAKPKIKQINTNVTKCRHKNNSASNSNKRLKNINNVIKKKHKKQINSERTNSLRSKGHLKNVSLKKLIGKEEEELNFRRNGKKQASEQQKLSRTNLGTPSINSTDHHKTKSISSQCEIVSVSQSTEEDHIDLENFMDDMINFNNLSEEHKKCLIENRILSTKPITQLPSIDGAKEQVSSRSLCSLQSISPLCGFNKTDFNEVKKMYEAYKGTSMFKTLKPEIEDFGDTSEVKVEENEINDQNEIKTENMIIESITETSNNNNKFEIVTTDVDQKKKPNRNNKLQNGISLLEHDYAGLRAVNDEEEEDEDKEIDVVTVPSQNIRNLNFIEINPRDIERQKYEVLPYNKSIEMKSLHRSLQFIKRKNNNFLPDQSLSQEWDSGGTPKQKIKRQSHYIKISQENGAVLKAFYIDYNLIVCQESAVSFWMQTPLGNVLGSQNMWIPRGQTPRLVLNNKCMQKESMEMVISMETNIAYIELWTKEHKSDIREGPVADVFATVYFWKQRQNGLEKKVLQLENINGFADDVQYSVIKCSPKIIVSWHSATEDNVTKRTFVHAYKLALDYQTVSNIYDIEPVEHYVSSLHNIEDCDNLIMGSGENKITLWNVEYGYIIATIELSEIKSPLSTLWVKCDRGFLFALQQCVDRELRLIAINGIDHSWKKLASYIPPEGFDRLRGVCIENGLLLSFYDQGILCWKAETGEPVEETNLETDIIPSGRYVILVEDSKIFVKHVMTHIMSMSVDDC